ncbi:dihydroxyacetone kinase subunit DhaK [Phytohabitans kaempferiae]|uniref:Dihydroxyacetone kinase subunit DhaK n=1 Tax=Phytohabitans kaempferiae TaxID=1620943 RepID=A0ABV6M9V2_9ACTN
MQKIINDPEDFVDEVLDGILLAHPGWLRAVEEEPRALVRAAGAIPGKVGIATGGGSGHLPVFLGYVGEGLADGVAVGNVFASPSARQMLAVTRAVDAGAGVLHLYGNYQGDTLHFETAAEQAEAEGIAVRSVRVCDDVASAPAANRSDRRGVAGIVFAYKLAGARAAEGADLDAVTATAADAVANTRSLGVALAPSTVPTAGRPTFTLDAGEMELGMGIHGEPGVRRGPLARADEITADLVDTIVADLPFVAGDRVAVLVNGLGATPLEELYVVYRAVRRRLDGYDITVHRGYVGEYATSLEMAGCSVSLLRLDDERTRLLDAPAYSPLFRQGGGW